MRAGSGSAVGTQEKPDTKNIISLQYEVVGTTLCYRPSVSKALGSRYDVWGGDVGTCHPYPKVLIKSAESWALPQICRIRNCADVTGSSIFNETPSTLKFKPYC